MGLGKSVVMAGISINHYLAPPGYPLQSFLDDAVSAGANGIGITERALSEAALPVLKAMLRERGLGVTSVNSAGFFLWADPERAKLQRSTNTRLLEAAAELEADTLVVIGGGLHDMAPQDNGQDLTRARAAVEAELPALIEAARKYGVRLGVEPMHPLRIFTKGTVNTLAQAAALCDRLPGLGIVLDLFHVWWDPDLEPMLARFSDRLTLVQLSGVMQPRNQNAVPRRCLLNQGSVDVGGILRALKQCGYQGRFEFELFAEDLDGQKVAEVMASAVAEFASVCRY